MTKEILKKLTTIEKLLRENRDKPLSLEEAATYAGKSPNRFENIVSRVQEHVIQIVLLLLTLYGAFQFLKFTFGF